MPGFDARRPLALIAGHNAAGERFGEGWLEETSREAFAGMVMSAEYQAIAHHRLAGLEGQLNIDTKPRTS